MTDNANSETASLVFMPGYEVLKKNWLSGSVASAKTSDCAHVQCAALPALCLNTRSAVSMKASSAADAE
jgi:hypothetical protein